MHRSSYWWEWCCINSRPVPDRVAVGQVVLSLGFIFLGIGTIKAAAAGAADNPDLMKLLEIAQRYPIGMAALAAVTTFGLQSATATIGLVIGLGVAGAVELPLAVAVVAGANVGVVITALLVGWNQVESRRLAASNMMAKLLCRGAGFGGACLCSGIS